MLLFTIIRIHRCAPRLLLVQYILMLILMLTNCRLSQACSPSSHSSTMRKSDAYLSASFIGTLFAPPPAPGLPSSPLTTIHPHRIKLYQL